MTAQTANFTTLPENREVREGRNITFQCSVNDGINPLQVIWRLRNGSELIADISINQPLVGTDGVIVGPDNRSPLTLTSVLRSLNDITVSCVARINVGQREEQRPPRANLSVICKYRMMITFSLECLHGYHLVWRCLRRKARVWCGCVFLCQWA